MNEIDLKTFEFQSPCNYEPLTTNERNDQIYLNNMEINDIPIELEDDDFNDKGENLETSTNEPALGNSILTLKDLQVTNRNEEDPNEEDCTPLSTMCNYYLQTESNNRSNTKSIKKKIESNKENFPDNIGTESTPKKNYKKYFTKGVSKKIDFNDDNLNHTNRTINAEKINYNDFKGKVIQLSLYDTDTPEKKKEKRILTTVGSTRRCKEKKISLISQAKYECSNRSRTKSQPKTKSTSVTKNKSTSRQKNIITKQIKNDTLKRMCHSLNKKKSVSPRTKAMNDKKNMRDFIIKIKSKSKSNSKQPNNSGSVPKKMSNPKQNKKETYNTIQNIKIHICSKGDITSVVKTPLTKPTTTKKKPLPNNVTKIPYSSSIHKNTSNSNYVTNRKTNNLTLRKQIKSRTNSSSKYPNNSISNASNTSTRIFTTEESQKRQNSKRKSSLTKQIKKFK